MQNEEAPVLLTLKLKIVKMSRSVEEKRFAGKVIADNQ